MTDYGKALMRLRKEENLPKFESKCRITFSRGHWVKAFRVPGTEEHGVWSMKQAQVTRRLQEMFPQNFER